MNKPRLIHARTRVVNYQQKRVTALCGRRVIQQHAFYSAGRPHTRQMLDIVTCPGCKALMAELNKTDHLIGGAK